MKMIKYVSINKKMKNYSKHVFWSVKIYCKFFFFSSNNEKKNMNRRKVIFLE